LDATAGARIASIWDGLFADQRAHFIRLFPRGAISSSVWPHVTAT